MSDYITTYTGRKIRAHLPTPEDICLEDIAAGLRQFRFAAQTDELMTVAQHSMHVSSLLTGTTLQLEGLFHDAHEAYLGDLTTPFKKFCHTYQALERKWDLAIREKYTLMAKMPDEVLLADKQACLQEARYLGMDDAETWELPELRDDQSLEIVMCLKPNVAMQNWLALAIKLLNKRAEEFVAKCQAPLSRAGGLIRIGRPVAPPNQKTQ